MWKKKAYNTKQHPVAIYSLTLTRMSNYSGGDD